MAFADDGQGRTHPGAILRHLELHPYYNEQEAAEAFAMSLRRFLRREELVGLEPCWYEEGMRPYRWDRLIPRVERYWSKRVVKKGW